MCIRDREMGACIDLEQHKFEVLHGFDEILIAGLSMGAVAGKTGTAEESKSHPNHGWFIGYAPCENPKIAVAVRVANGYSSGNVVGVGRNIFSYYFQLEPVEHILTGQAAQVSDNVRTD